MEFKLRGKGLWDTISGPHLTQPFLDHFLENGADENAVNEDAASLEYKKAKKKWKSYSLRSAKAMDKIYNSISEALQPTIEECQNPVDMWNKLKNIYQDTNKSRGASATQLRSQLSRMEYTMGDKGGIDKFFASVQRIVNNIFEIEGKINCEKIESYLFLMMPPEMKYYKSALQETLENKPLDYLQIMERFRTEILTLEREQEREEAMFAKKGGNSSHNNNNRKPKGKWCEFCKKPGHLIEKCFKKDPKNKAEYDKKKAEADKTVWKRPSEGNLLQPEKKKIQGKKPLDMSKLEEFGLMAVDSLEEEEESEDGELILTNEWEDVYYLSREAVKKQSLTDWVADLGTSKMMAANKAYFVTLQKPSKDTFIQVGNGAKIRVKGIGSVRLNLALLEEGLPKRYRNVVVHEVLFAPKLMTNLLPISDLARLGISTTFEGVNLKAPTKPLRARFFMKETNQTVATATLKVKHYILDLGLPRSVITFAFKAEISPNDDPSIIEQIIDISDDSEDEAMVLQDDSESEESTSREKKQRTKRHKPLKHDDSNDAFEAEDSEWEHQEVDDVTELLNSKDVTAYQYLWHHLLGHASPESMRQVAKIATIKGAKNLSGCKLGEKTCQTCAEGKGHAAPHTSNMNKAVMRVSELLETVHADTAGPIKPASHGYRYFMVFVDDYTRYTTVAFLKKKSEGLSKIKLYVKTMETQSNRQVKRLKTDNGSEFISKAHSKFYRSQGIIHEKSTPY